MTDHPIYFYKNKKFKHENILILTEICIKNLIFKINLLIMRKSQKSDFQTF